MFGSAPESIKNPFRGLAIKNLLLSGLSKRSGIFQVFS